MAMNWAAFSATVFASAINPASPNSLQEQIQDIINNSGSITTGQWYVKQIQALAPSNPTERGYIDGLPGMVVYQLELAPYFAGMDSGVPYYIYSGDAPLNGCTFYFALVDGTHPIPPLP